MGFPSSASILCFAQLFHEHLTFFFLSTVEKRSISVWMASEAGEKTTARSYDPSFAAAELGQPCEGLRNLTFRASPILELATTPNIRNRRDDFKRK
jgi:hypothetical protein